MRKGVRSPRVSKGNFRDQCPPDGRARHERIVKTDNQKPGRSTGRKTSVAAKNGDTFKKLRVMVLCHEDLVPPDTIDGLTPKEISPFKTEWDVISTLKKMGHEVCASWRL